MGRARIWTRAMLERILPGPVTVLLRQRAAGDGGAAAVSSALNPDVDLIGVRVPGSDFVREVCRAHGGAIALTSANRSSEASTTSATGLRRSGASATRSSTAGRSIPGVWEHDRGLSSTDRHFRIVREGERCAELVRVLEDEFDLKKRAADDAPSDTRETRGSARDVADASTHSL